MNNIFIFLIKLNWKAAILEVLFPNKSLSYIASTCKDRNLMKRIKKISLIQLRKIGTKEIFDYYLSGDEPAYVDMPIWYTHNIKNIGEEELYTMFWINEFYDAKDPDTYFEKV